jgi:ADP-ribose pyrophosphatase YjhB (NUDIX family)
MSTLLKFVLQIRRLFWKIFKPQTQGVRAIAIDKSGKILLVKHTYSNNWFLPGGKVRRKEKKEDAILRELYEETGVVKSEGLHEFGVYQNTREYKRDTITVFLIHVTEQVQKSHFEIENSQFFTLNDIPENTSPGTKRRLGEYTGKLEKSFTW